MQRHKEVERLLARHIHTCIDLSLASHLADVVGGGSSVMSVRDVGVGHFCKLFLQQGRLFKRTTPKYVTHSVITSDICIARARGDLLYQLLNRFLVLTESEENRPNVCVLNAR